jgi:tricorn protease
MKDQTIEDFLSLKNIDQVSISPSGKFVAAVISANFREYDKKALIVDIRYNSGGFVSSLLLEKLNRKVIGFDEPRYGLHTSYPSESVQGPIVAITNEDAGSDGDIFSHAFKLFKLGPLIGKRTWGGVVGINPKRALIDGTIVTALKMLKS